MKLYKDICSGWISRTSAEIYLHRLTSWTSQKYNRSTVILRRTLLWIFGKWIKILADFKKPWNLIVYKKTDEWYIEWQRGTTNDNDWQQMVQRVTTNDNEWYKEWQQMTTSDNEWQRVVSWVTNSDNEWYNEWQRVTTNGNVWQRVTAVVQLMQTAQYASKNGWLPSIQW